MSQVILGAKVTAGAGLGFYVVQAQSTNWNQVGTTSPTYPEGLFIHKIGIFGGRAGSNNAKLRLTVWAKKADGLPGALLAHTGLITVGANGVYEFSIAWNSIAPSATGAAVPGLRLPAGAEVIVGIHNENAGLEVYEPLGATAKTVYRRNVGAGLPTNPFGTPNTTTDVLNVWMVGETNTPPEAALTGPPAVVSSLTPTFTGTFTDPDVAAPMLDGFRWYQLELRTAASPDIIWSFDTLTTNAERLSGAFSKLYSGIDPLVEGDYLARVRVQDDLLTISEWSDWRAFTISGAGYFEMDNASPVGKLENGLVPSWIARWKHPAPFNVKAVDIRVRAGGVVIRSLPAPLAITQVAANELVTVPAAAVPTLSSASNLLPPSYYQWEIRGQDTSNVWSPWSPLADFSVNFPPNQPSNLDPPSGVTLTERPELRWEGSDPDLDDVLGIGVFSEIEVTRPNGVVYVITPVYDVDPATGEGLHLLTESEAAFTSGFFEWRVRLADLLGAGPASVYGPWSAKNAFTLSVAPKINITFPEQSAVVGTSTPTFLWGVTDGSMLSYQVDVYRGLLTTPIYSSGRIFLGSPVTSGGYLLPPNVLLNSTAYSVAVTTWTAAGVSSTSARRSFTVQFEDADSLGTLEATLLGYAGDYESTSVSLAWSRTEYSQAEFEGYVIKRRTAEQTLQEATTVAKLTSPGQREYVDHIPIPNAPLIYSVTQLRKVGRDVRSSQPVETEVYVAVTVPVMVSLRNPPAVRAPVMWLSQGLNEGFLNEEATVDTWGTGGVPTLLANAPGHGYVTKALSFNLKSDQWGAASEKRDRWREIVRHGQAYCLITEDERLFCRVVAGDNWLKRGKVAGTFDVQLGLEEIANVGDIVLKS